jgi:hypothetical protein
MLGLGGGGTDNLNAMTAGRPYGGSLSFSVDPTSVGIPGSIMESEAAAGQVGADIYWAGDTDFDGFSDFDDNCRLTPNPSQFDADVDGFGNACDPDFDNNCIVDTADLDLFMLEYGGSNPVYDLDEPPDGSVGPSDFEKLAAAGGEPPGPDVAGTCAGLPAATRLLANRMDLGAIPTLPRGVPYSFLVPDDLDALDNGPAPLGLADCADEVDGLHLDTATGDLYYSLAPGSPSLTPGSPIVDCGTGCSAADIFIAPGGGPPAALFRPALELGLLPSDNVDALLLPEPGGLIQLGAGGLLLVLLGRRRLGAAEPEP